MTRKDHSEVSNQLYANYAIGKDVQVITSVAAVFRESCTLMLTSTLVNQCRHMHELCTVMAGDESCGGRRGALQ